MLKKHKNQLIEYFGSSEYQEALKKFRGYMCSRGRISWSYKFFDEIKIKIKNRFRKDPTIIMKRSVYNIAPFVGYMSKRIGRRVHISPILLKKHKRYTLMINWLIKSQKNRSNILGIKVNDIVNNIINAFYKKGEAFKMKKNYVKKALNARYILLQKNRFSKFRSRAIVKKMKKTIASKFLSKKIIDLDKINKIRIKNFMKSMLFLKYKNYKYKKPIRIFKKLLYKNWVNNTIENKLYVLDKWLNSPKKGRLPLNTRRLERYAFLK